MIRKEKRDDCQRFRDLEWNAAGKRGRINDTESIGDWKVAELSPLFYFLPLVQRDNQQEKQKY